SPTTIDSISTRSSRVSPRAASPPNAFRASRRSSPTSPRALRREIRWPCSRTAPSAAFTSSCSKRSGEELADHLAVVVAELVDLGLPEELGQREEEVLVVGAAEVQEGAVA